MPKPSQKAREWIEPAEAEVTGLDKAWHCIHFLLAGDAAGGAPPGGYLLELLRAAAGIHASGEGRR